MTAVVAGESKVAIRLKIIPSCCSNIVVTELSWSQLIAFRQLTQVSIGGGDMSCDGESFEMVEAVNQIAECTELRFESQICVTRK